MEAPPTAVVPPLPPTQTPPRAIAPTLKLAPLTPVQPFRGPLHLVLAACMTTPSLLFSPGPVCAQSPAYQVVSKSPPRGYSSTS